MRCNNYDETVTDTFVLKIPHNNIGPVLGTSAQCEIGLCYRFVQELGFEHKAEVTIKTGTLKTPQIGRTLTF
jgi:hypothetical protein